MLSVGGKYFVRFLLFLAFWTPNTFAQNISPNISIDPTFNLKVSPPPQIYPKEASWIWNPDDDGTRKFAEFRKIIDVGDPNEPASLFITAYKSFVLKVNGTKVGETKFSDKEGWKQTHYFQISKFLKKGNNIISVRVLSDKKHGGLLAWIELGKAFIWTDESWDVKSDNEWTSAEILGPASALFFPNDTEEGLNGWPNYFPQTPEHLRHIFLPVARILDVHGPIEGQNSFVTGSVSLTVDSSKSHREDYPYIVLDFGKELAGRLVLKSDQISLALVSVGESLEEIKTPYHKYKVVTTGAGSSSTDNTAFRYAKISFPPVHGLALKRTYTEIDVDHDFYPVEYKGSFDSSDPLLTKIWYTGAYTTHLCMQDDIWDAPKRDRVAWMGDLHISGEVINTVFGDSFLMKKTLSKLRREAQGEHGPAEPPVKHINLIPGYSSAWIFAMADFYRHSGDLEFLFLKKNILFRS